MLLAPGHDRAQLLHVPLPDDLRALSRAGHRAHHRLRSRPTRASRSRRCGRSSGSCRRSFRTIRRSPASSALPAGGRPTPASSTSRSSPSSERKDHRRRGRDAGCAASSRRWRARASSWSRCPDLRTGGRQSNATYQYTLQSDDTAELYTWAPKLIEALMRQRRRQGRQFRSAAGRAGDRYRHRPRHRDAARPDARTRSTTRFTTRSASGRSRPSTARRTSTTW